jgi:hypothetical protein
MTREESRKLRVALAVLSGRKASIDDIDYIWERLGRRSFQYGSVTIDDVRLQAEEIVFELLCKMSPFEETEDE